MHFEVVSKSEAERVLGTGMSGPDPRAIPLPLSLLPPSNEVGVEDPDTISWQDDFTVSTGSSSSRPDRHQEAGHSGETPQHDILASNAFQDTRRSENVIDELAWRGKTTLVMHNVPTRFSVDALLRCLQPHEEIDFVFLPYRPHRRCCSRYAFLNFVTPEAALQFASQWKDKWLSDRDPSTASFKQLRPLAFGLAATQGLAANLQLHMQAIMENSRFGPVVFYHGQRLQFPKDLPTLSRMVSEGDWILIEEVMAQVVRMGYGSLPVSLNL